MQKDIKRNGSFLREALIISVSNFVVKIIGVLYKVPLADMLQDSMGVFTAAYSIYAMLFMISTSGLPATISRMIAAAAGRGRKRESDRVFSISLIVFGSIGLVCAVGLYLLSEPIAIWSQHEDAGGAMRVIAPTLFFICITSACRGYFQGLRNMYPTAISQFIEAFFKLTIGIGAVIWARDAGYSPVEQAAFAISGLTVGVFFGTGFLLLYKRFSHRSFVEKLTDECDSDRQIFGRMVSIALPVTITASALYMTQFLDTLVINRCLTSSGYALEVAERIYAAYTTLAISISDLLPSTLVYPIAISILPAVTSSLTAGNVSDAKKYITQSLRITGIIGIPCATCLCVLARPCISLIYGSAWGMGSGEITLASGATLSPVTLASGCLSLLSIGIIFISLLSTSNALLQACGKPRYPMYSIGIGVALLIVAEIALVSLPFAGIYGAPLATLICYGVALALNINKLKKELGGIRINTVSMFGKPFICSVIASAVCAAVYFGGMAVSGGAESRFACLIYLGVSVLTAVPAYAVALIAMKGITASEVALLPKGRTLSAFLVKKGFLAKDE